MSRHAWILLVAFLSVPPPLAAQPLDSVRAHALAAVMADDIRSLSSSHDLLYLRHGLPVIEAYFGIGFEEPEFAEGGPGPMEVHLNEVYRVHGSRELMDEASRLEGQRDGILGPLPIAVRILARAEGPTTALESALERDVLESAMSRILIEAGLERLDEVLGWIDEADIDSDQRLRLKAHALGHGSIYEPFHFWQRADALPDPYRTEVRARALTASSTAGTIPDHVLEVALPGMLEVGRGLEAGAALDVVRAVDTTCGRRELQVCANLDLQTHDYGEQARMDVINLTRTGAFGQAERRLEELRGRDAPLAVARVMAQGLETLAHGDLDLVRIDSLAAAWSGEIFAAEAAALEGRIERTAISNGRDDLTEGCSSAPDPWRPPVPFWSGPSNRFVRGGQKPPGTLFAP